MGKVVPSDSKDTMIVDAIDRFGQVSTKQLSGFLNLPSRALRARGCSRSQQIYDLYDLETRQVFNSRGTEIVHAFFIKRTGQNNSKNDNFVT